MAARQAILTSERMWPDTVNGPGGILLRSSAVGYWHGEGTAGASEAVEIVREPKNAPPQPVVNALALDVEEGDPQAPAGFRYRAASVGSRLGAHRLDGTVLEMALSADAEPTGT